MEQWILECLTCRTPRNGLGPAVEPRRLKSLDEAKREEDSAKWHRKRGHRLNRRPVTHE